MNGTKMIGFLSLAMVLWELSKELKEWGELTLADGELDAEEAALLGAPLERSLNKAVQMPPGKRIVVSVYVADETEEGEI